ncbi:MAG: hypothetical protein U9R53_01425 [Chloroflexota bacterium]|nr:hypothetical protein [Chloroflexota bacterium]
MKNNKHKQRIILLIVLGIVLIGTIIAIILATKPMPVALLAEYDLKMLWD